MFQKFVFLATLMVAIFAQAPAMAWQYVGEAKPLSVNLLGIVGIYAGTGQLPITGGNLSSSVASVNLTTGGIIPTTVVTTGLMTGSTVGGSGVVNSSAHIDNAFVLPSIIPALTLLKADVIESFANASGSGTNGFSTITNLRVLGVAVTVTGAVNQTYSVPGILNLTINKQFLNPDRSLTVRALELDIIDPLNVGTVILSESTAGVAPEPGSMVLVVMGGILLGRRMASRKS